MKKVLIYTMDYCPYCTRAKSLLTSKKIAFEEIHVERSDVAIWDELQKKTGMRTMPQIFAGDYVIGGCTDLEALASKVDIVEFINQKLKE